MIGQGGYISEIILIYIPHCCIATFWRECWSYTNSVYSMYVGEDNCFKIVIQPPCLHHIINSITHSRKFLMQEIFYNFWPICILYHYTYTLVEFLLRFVFLFWRYVLYCTLMFSAMRSLHMFLFILTLL